MTIKVAGLSGSRTLQAILNAQGALGEFDHDAKVTWVSDPYELFLLNIAHTPAIIINEKLKASGRIPSIHELTLWIEEELVDELAA